MKPALEHDRCAACDEPLRHLSRADRWTHYLEHLTRDPIPERFLTAPEKRKLP